MMRDYATISKRLRQYSENCVAYKLDADFANAVTAAADAIEELQDQIAEVGKMVNELIVYAQKEADEWRASQNASYGDDRTVSVYTWANNAKCTHERYVAKLDDIAAKLPAPPKGVE